jgi:hypothetical protein
MGVSRVSPLLLFEIRGGTPALIEYNSGDAAPPFRNPVRAVAGVVSGDLSSMGQELLDVRPFFV